MIGSAILSFGPTALLFERTWVLLIVLIAAQFALICVWSWQRTTATKRLVWIGFALIPVLLTLSVWVVTDRERIIELCHELAHYVDKGNAPAILTRLADTFHADTLDRVDFEARLFSALKRDRIDDPETGSFTVTFPRAHEAVATFDVGCYVRNEEGFNGWLRSRWRLFFRRDDGAWRVTGIEVVPTPFSPLRDLHRWLR